MTTQDLLGDSFEVATDPRFDIERMKGGDGYDVMEAVRAGRWAAVPSWGADGWDLGSWPYVVVYVRRHDDAYELVYYVEGDTTTYRYATQDQLFAAIDELAMFHWQGDENGPDVSGFACVDELPANYRGPYGRERSTA